MSITQFLWESYRSIPIVTRVCITFTLILALALHIELISKYDLYFNPSLTFGKFQLWRLVTCFFYMDQNHIACFVLNIIFSSRICWALEANEFADKKEDFVIMIISGMSMLLTHAYIIGDMWLTDSLSIFILYVWSRRNPEVLVELNNLFIFPAAFVPLAVLIFSMVVSNPFRDGAFIGFLVGHTYYHAYFVYPAHPHGFNPLRAPLFMKRWFNSPHDLDVVEEQLSTYQSQMLVASTYQPEMRDASTSTVHDFNIDILPNDIFESADVDRLTLTNRDETDETH